MIQARTALTKAVFGTAIVATLGLGGPVGQGAVASAAPAVPAPEKPPGHHDFCPPRCDGPRGPKHDHKWGDKGVWWATNRHDWWDDRQGPPPWGWGPPPPYHWHGGPPHPFNYWGYDVTPVWHDGFRQWGIWLFGIWIPIFGIGVV